MKTNISIVMPVHNEEKHLPFSLKPLMRFEGEIVFVLDRCSDRSMEILERFVRGKSNCRIVVKTGQGLCSPNPAWDAYLYGTQYAHGTFVYWVGADMVIPSDLWMYCPFRAAKYEYVDYPNHLGFAWFKLLSKFTKHFAVEAFRKDCLGEFDFPEEDILQNAQPRGCFELVRLKGYTIFHLRRTKNVKRQLVQGVVRRRVGVSFLKVLLHSVLFWKPHVLVGYLFEVD